MLANHISLPRCTCIHQELPFHYFFPFLLYMKQKVAKLQNTWPLTCNKYFKCCHRSPTVIIIHIINVHKKNTKTEYLIFKSTMWLQHCSSSHQTNSDFIIQRLQHYGTALLVVKLTQTSVVHDCRSTTCTTVVPYHLIFVFFTLKINNMTVGLQEQEINVIQSTLRKKMAAVHFITIPCEPD